MDDPIHVDITLTWREQDGTERRVQTFANVAPPAPPPEGAPDVQERIRVLGVVADAAIRAKAAVEAVQ